MVDVKIEVRCQGGFAFLRGAGGKRWLAVPPPPAAHPHQEHLCHLIVPKDAVAPGDQDKFVNTNPSFPTLLDGFLRFKQTIKRLEIVGAKKASHKPEIAHPLTDSGLPDNDGTDDSSWTSQKFIASMRQMYPPPQAEPVAHVDKAAFVMTLPNDTEWHGLKPSDGRMRKCKWKFVKQGTNETVITKHQAITDIVGFHLNVPPTTTLVIHTSTGQVTLTMTFVAGSKVKLVAGPEGANLPQVGQNLQHFEHLYNLCDPKPPHDVVPRCVGPLDSSFMPAGDVFCPGGEGEGEGGG